LITQAEAVHYQAGSEFLPLIEEVNTLAAASPSHRRLPAASGTSLGVVSAMHGACPRFLGTLGCQHAAKLIKRDVAKLIKRGGYGTQVYRTLTSKMEPIPGAKVENNKFCLSVHFRCVQEEVCPDRDRCFTCCNQFVFVSYS
jgi:hypothetical protein